MKKSSTADPELPEAPVAYHPGREGVEGELAGPVGVRSRSPRRAAHGLRHVVRGHDGSFTLRQDKG